MFVKTMHLFGYSYEPVGDGASTSRGAQYRFRQHRGHLQTVGDIHECPAVAQYLFLKQCGYIVRPL